MVADQRPLWLAWTCHRRTPVTARHSRAAPGAGVVLLEGLINLDCLPREFTLIALPLPLDDLDGSPVRAVALVP